jgi:hypothetical protein
MAAARSQYAALMLARDLQGVAEQTRNELGWPVEERPTTVSQRVGSALMAA